MKALSYLLVIIGIIALMAEPTDEQVANYNLLLFGSKAVMLIAFAAAIMLNTSRKEEQEFLDKQPK